MKKSSCLVIAGEKSGEEFLLSFISNLDDFHLFGVAGLESNRHGMELLYDLKDFNAFGFGILSKIPFYLYALKRIEDEVIRRNCKVAILIDFQEFNLRLVKLLKKHGVSILYIVSPKVWVWRPKRIEIIKQVDILYSIFPFEKDIYKDKVKILNIEHPLYTRFKDKLSLKQHTNEINNLLVLPGSRNSEIIHLLPSIIESIKDLELTKSILVADSINFKLIEPYLKYFDHVYTGERMQEALLAADLAITASGTVTLALAMFRIPSIVVYKLSWFNNLIYKYIIKYKGFVSLPNLILKQEVFPELLQEDFTVKNMKFYIEFFRKPDIYKAKKEQILKIIDYFEMKDVDLATSIEVFLNSLDL